MPNYAIMLDTETANDLESPMMYDCGFAVVDLDNGEIVERHSYVIAEIYLDKEFMSTAFFRDKIPQYEADLKNGTRKLVRLATCKKILADAVRRYNAEYLVAHNARFDYRSTNGTQRYMTSSKYRYFLPYGLKVVDTLKMARIKYKKDEKYGEFCYNNNFLTARGQRRYTAEILYRFISGNNNFIEEHTALEDASIEAEILMDCLKTMSIEEGVLW